MPIFDVHTHAVAADHARYPLAPVGGTLSDWAKERPATAEALLAALDAAGIAQALVVQASTAYGYDNRYAADSAAAHPARFAWVGGVDVLAPDGPDRLAYWVHERGMAGLRVFSTASTRPEQSPLLGDPASFPTWERARDLGIPVAVQMRFAGLPLLRRLLDRFPDVPILLDHCGRPPLDDGPPYTAAQPLFDLAAHPNVYLKFTTVTLQDAACGRSTPRALLEQLVATFGAHRLAWGSNFPASEGALPTLATLARDALAFLPESDQQQILGGTARALYPALCRVSEAP